MKRLCVALRYPFKDKEKVLFLCDYTYIDTLSHRHNIVNI